MAQQRPSPGNSKLRSIRRGFQSRYIRDMFDAALAAGWAWRMAGSTHVLLLPPQGGATITLSTTSKTGAMLTRVRLRAVGLDV